MTQLAKQHISYSGVSGLRPGVCSPVQPLVPTGVRSPLLRPTLQNRWKHFLSSSSSARTEGRIDYSDVRNTFLCLLTAC